jgi:uncharacterized protein DUF3887
MTALKASLVTISLAVVMFAGSFAAFSAISVDLRCDELLSALRDGNFTAATAHFDPTMKAALSPDMLGKVWLQIVSDNGKLEKWDVIQKGKINGIDVRMIELTFEHGKQISTISVRSESGEVAGLYFKPVPGTT